MLHNFVYDDVTQALPDLLARLETADEINSRAGLTKELSHVSITFLQPWKREILEPYRKPNLAAQVAETMWVLTGRDDIGWLEHYLPRCRDFSDDGLTWRAGYGKRLRFWEDHGHAKTIDQLAYIVNTLKASPSSRQAVMSIWDPAIDTDPGKDIPCNNWLSFNSRLGSLDLTVAIRSNDIIWGWSGINQFEWSALQEIVASMLGLRVGVLNFVQTSFHLYDRHFAKAHKIVEHREHVGPVDSSGLTSVRFDAKRFGSTLKGFDDLADKWFLIEKMIRNGDDASSLVELFPEPMMQAWLRVLQWWWIDDEFLAPLEGTTLEAAAKVSVQPKRPDPVLFPLLAQGGIMEPEMVSVHDGYGNTIAEWPMSEFKPSEFIQFSIRTHDEKHQAYGDSWKRRGEMLGIMANIARKVDRLGGSETADETSADTAMDLMVYLAKYRAWLTDSELAVDEKADHPANHILLRVDDQGNDWSQTEAQSKEELEQFLRDRFNELEGRVMADEPRFELVDDMLVVAYVLAKRLWDIAEVLKADEYRGADHD